MTDSSPRRSPNAKGIYPNLPGTNDDEEYSDVDVEEDLEGSQSYKGTPVKDRYHGDRDHGRQQSKSPESDRSGRMSRSPHISNKPDDSDLCRGCKGNRLGFTEKYGGYIIVAFLVVFVAAAISLVINRPRETSESMAVTYTGVKKMLNEQKGRFVSQKKEMWKSLGSVSKRIFDATDPEYPGVILMASKENARTTSYCLINKIRDYFQHHINISGDLHIDASKLSSSEPDDQKIKIHEGIENVIRPVSQFLTITNLETLTPDAAMIFHSYCDNSNAQYKKVLYILQLNIPDTFTKDELNDKLVESYLRHLWLYELGHDKLSSLLSRIANNIVVVEQESDASLSKICG